MMKSSSLQGTPIVSYRTARYKAIAVPSGKRPAIIRDITQFHARTPPKGRTDVQLRRTASHLLLDVRCREPDPSAVRAGNTRDGMDVWSGDLIEIHFGAIEPAPWQLQLAVGAGGGRFDSSGQYDQWSAVATCDRHGWRAQVAISLTMLRLANLGTGFNICRQSLARGEFSSWTDLEVGFHEVENYGELLFCDYNTAWFARTGVSASRRLDRPSYEQAIEGRRLPAETVVHGPFLSNPSEEGMTVTWATAGMTGARLEYREAGEAAWREQPVGLDNGILRCNARIHVAHLAGLRPGTAYQYRLVNLTPVLARRSFWPRNGRPASFRTLDPDRETFTFAACSDIHSNVMVLDRLMGLPEVERADFFVNLGDMLSHMSGPEASFAGFLDLQAERLGHRRPLVFVRGNHEQVGLFGADYFTAMEHPSGRSYYAFRQGRVCFLALDTGNDHADDEAGLFRNADMIAEERRWLRRTVGSEMFRTAEFRVAFLHMPPYNDDYGSKAGLALIDGMFDRHPLHLMISGHVHHYFRIDPFSGVCTSPHPSPTMQNTPVLPFTVVANDTHTAVIVRCRPQALDVRVVDADGSLVDRLSIAAAR